MRHIEPITVTVTGLSKQPHHYEVSPATAKQVEQMLKAAVSVTQQRDDFIPAQAAFPDLFDAEKGAGIVLRGMRYREDMTQKQLADKLGIRQHHLSEMENGKRPIGKEMAKKLAAILNADYRVFL